MSYKLNYKVKQFTSNTVILYKPSQYHNSLQCKLSVNHDEDFSQNRKGSVTTLHNLGASSCLHPVHAFPLNLFSFELKLKSVTFG